VPVLDELDAAALRAWGDTGLAALGRARVEIDALNVFPVPDGDTGTNLFLTFEAGVTAAAAELTSDPAALTAAFSRGALLGARGNSGVILSQLLRGMSESFSHLTVPVRGQELGAALGRAAELGYAAVARPVEGTVLTVMRAAAAAASADQSLDLVATVGRATGAARDALAKTPDQLAALKAAGVVDAGGRGLVVLLEALQTVVTGGAAPTTSWERPTATPDRPVHGADPLGPAFEVMYLVETSDEAAPSLRLALDELGESVVVVGGDGLWNVHVHADDPGSVIEAGVAVGRPFRIRVTSLAEAVRPSEGAGARGVVAVVPGRGLAALFESVGATVVDGGPGQRPSLEQLIDATLARAASEIILLPNDSDHLAAAEVAADHLRGQGLRVAVVPTRAPVQGLAALAVHDATRRFDDDVVAMTSAAGSTRHGGITLAVREAITSAGICQAGDVLGLIDGDIAVIGSDLTVVAQEVVDRMLSGGGELVTIVQGMGSAGELAGAVKEHIHRTRPEVEVVCYDGEQAHYPLLLGVE